MATRDEGVSPNHELLLHYVQARGPANGGFQYWVLRNVNPRHLQRMGGNEAGHKRRGDIAATKTRGNISPKFYISICVYLGPKPQLRQTPRREVEIYILLAWGIDCSLAHITPCRAYTCQLASDPDGFMSQVVVHPV